MAPGSCPAWCLAAARGGVADHGPPITLHLQTGREYIRVLVETSPFLFASTLEDRNEFHCWFLGKVVTGLQKTYV